MDEWVVNGSQLAWLINPEEKLTYVYTAGKMKTVSFEGILSGETVMHGFEIRLNSIIK